MKLVAAFITGNQRPVMVDRVKIILLSDFIPDAAVNDNAVPVLWCIGADFFRRINPEIIGRQFRKVDHMEPLHAGGASGYITVINIAAVCQRFPVCFKADLSLMDTCSRNNLYQAGVIFRFSQRNTVSVNFQVFSVRTDIIPVQFFPFELPHGDVTVIGNEQFVAVVAGFCHDRQRFGLQRAAPG